MEGREKPQVGPLRVIGRIRTPFAEARGTPIQAAYARGVEGRSILEEALGVALDDIEGLQRIWLVYWPDRAAAFRPRVVPRHAGAGLFATRSTRRPNPIGLSVIRVTGRVGCVLHVTDVDILDDTPLIDVKPYVPEFDSHPSIKGRLVREERSGPESCDGCFHDAADLTRKRRELSSQRSAPSPIPFISLDGAPALSKNWPTITVTSKPVRSAARCSPRRSSPGRPPGAAGTDPGLRRPGRRSPRGTR